MEIKGCILPWVHAFGNLHGKYNVCCISEAAPFQESFNLGDSTQSIEEVWHGDAYKNIRKQMLDGEVPSQCKDCFNKADLGVIDNPKDNANKRWQKYDYYQQTLEPPLPKYIDFRFGNICNFRCRMCGPTSSTSWFKESKEIFNRSGTLLNNWENEPIFWDNIEKIYPTLEMINFAGGEPLVLEGHYKLLEFLITHNKTEISLYYNTNLSILNFKNYNLLSMWDKFKEVHLWISCDGYRNVNDYIRKESKWDLFEENLIKIKKYINSISSVISIYSIYSMTDLILWAQEKNINVFGTTLVVPNFMSTQVLPETEKQKIITYYYTFLQNNKQKISPYYIKHIKDWLRFMMAEPPNREKLEIEFKRYTEKLDKSRSESFIEVVPELADWYNGIKIS